MDIIEVLASVVSAIASAVAAIFAYRAIKESKRNIFIRDKQQLAIVLRDMKFAFTSKMQHFKISEYPDSQRVLLNSKFFISQDFFNEVNVLLSRLHRFEASDLKSRNEDSQVVLEMIQELQCKTRLD